MVSLPFSSVFAAAEVAVACGWLAAWAFAGGVFLRFLLLCDDGGDRECDRGHAWCGLRMGNRRKRGCGVDRGVRHARIARRAGRQGSGHGASGQPCGKA